MERWKEERERRRKRANECRILVLSPASHFESHALQVSLSVLPHFVIQILSALAIQLLDQRRMQTRAGEDGTRSP